MALGQRQQNFGCPFNFGPTQVSYSHVNFAEKVILFDIPLGSSPPLGFAHLTRLF
jgi:hypothetical protein